MKHTAMLVQEERVEVCEMVRNEPYTTFMAEREEINDVIYEEVI